MLPGGPYSEDRLVNGLAATQRFSTLLVWCCFGFAAAALLGVALAGRAEAQGRRPMPGGGGTVGAACQEIGTPRGLANCLLEAHRAFVTERAGVAPVFLGSVYNDLTTPSPISCSSAGRQLKTDLMILANRFGARSSFNPDDCGSLAELYKEITGIPVKWCPPADYSYEHFSRCIGAAMERQGEREAFSRLITRVTRDPNVDTPFFPLAAALPRPLPAALEQQAAIRKNFVEGLRHDANACATSGVGKWGDMYANLVRAGLPRSAPGSSTEAFFARRKSVPCQDVVRLAIQLKLLGSDKLEAYARAQEEVDRARKAAQAAKCSPERAKAQPTADDLAAGLNAYVLASCDRLFVALRLVSTEQEQALPMLPLVKFKQEGRTCAVTSLSVKWNLSWKEVSQRQCTEVPGVGYSCRITGRLACESNARDAMREKFNCALYTLPQQGLVLATFDRAACDWRVAPVRRN
jgi:hypothetical protein